jgi:hypothetical protein
LATTLRAATSATAAASTTAAQGDLCVVADSSFTQPL